MQPDVHGRGIVGVAGVTEFGRQFLARGEAGVDIERLHQVDDRGAPFQLFALGGDRLVEDGGDIDRSAPAQPVPRGGADDRSAPRAPLGRALAVAAEALLPKIALMILPKILIVKLPIDLMIA